ncbi:MAG: hypothetical protein RIG68_09360 [Imperialibacter sp.]|uniref:hypothetical protein n=1 Tax=Imperialibacter sp. TaxID=2038411 RepID=UPI0032EC8A9A
MESLETFVGRLPHFDSLSSAEQIDYLVYYILIIEKKEGGAKAKEIEGCFSSLHIPAYSNINAYLGKFSKKSKHQKFIKRGTQYLLERRRKLSIDQEVGEVQIPKPTNDLFPMSLFQDTRGYLEKIAKQACICYDVGLYDASLVMTRKLIETLIIECFEKHQIESKIKGPDDHFFFLSDLIVKFQSENSWSISRNTASSLPQIKKYGDLSAHNRRFSAKKADLDKIKDDLRIVIDDLLHLIDFSKKGNVA